MNTNTQLFKFAVLIPKGLEEDVAACIASHAAGCDVKYRTTPYDRTQEGVLGDPTTLLDPHVWYYISLLGDVTQDLVVGLIGSYLYDTVRRKKSPKDPRSYYLPIRLPSGKLLKIRGTDPAVLQELRDAISDQKGK